MELYIHITVTLIFNFKLFLFFSSRLLGNIKPNFYWQFSTIFLSEVTNNFIKNRFFFIRTGGERAVRRPSSP